MDEYDLDILSSRADSSDLVLIYSFPSGIYRKESLLEVYVTLVFVLMAWDITSFIGYIEYCDIVVNIGYYMDRSLSFPKSIIERARGSDVSTRSRDQIPEH